MRIGYACTPLGIAARTTRKCLLKNCTDEKLAELISRNLEDLQVILEYNIHNGIYLFRITSDIIPFGSHPSVNFSWEKSFQKSLRQLGNLINKNNLRVSMHPGQYTVLNSPDESLVQKAGEDLLYHTHFLDSLGLNESHKIVLHIGGKYGDKAKALNRFCRNYNLLSEQVKKRLVLENDERVFNIEDVLQISGQTGAPVVYDMLHHVLNPVDTPLDKILLAVQATWKDNDGKMKIHYSDQAPGKNPGSHSQYIFSKNFLNFWGKVKKYAPDIMLEVKDKDLSAIKIINLLSGDYQGLERVWTRYKYVVMEKCPECYEMMEELLKEAKVKEAYYLIDSALAKPYNKDHFSKAALHVWHLMKAVSDKEKKHFLKLMENLNHTPQSGVKLKKYLLRLAQKNHRHHLLHSYYFLDIYTS